jgi:hypothetical protein
MPKLQDNRKKIETSLPSNEEAKIILRDGLLAGDVGEVEKVQSSSEQSLLMLCKMIESWNFTDEENNPLPINVENIKKMSMDDVNHLLDQVSFVKNFLDQRGKQSKI